MQGALRLDNISQPVLSGLESYSIEDCATVRISLEKKYAPIMENNPKMARLVSYVGNKSLPLLRLYRFKEAFSLGLVNHFLNEFNATSDDIIFDPFAGMGTT